jgi:DNA-binding NtrC family response regulator
MARILVVDDDAAIRLLFQMELEEEGYEVLTSDENGDVIGIIEKDAPDLVVLDMKMAGASGLDHLRNIRDRFDGLPVVICSAYPAPQQGSQETVFDFFVTKSSDLGPLKAVVGRALQGVYQGLDVE